MPDFAYIARDLKGQRVTGTVAAGSEREAVNVISGKSLFPIEVSVDKPKTGIQFGRRVKGQLMASTFGQLASLLRSGVPLLRTISIIRDQTSNSRLKEVLGEVHSQIEEGSTLAEAMARHPRIFSDMSINMVRAGGEGGFLEDALDRLGRCCAQEADPVR